MNEPPEPEMSLLGAVRTILGSMDSSAIRQLAEEKIDWTIPFVAYMRYIDQDEVISLCARSGIAAYLELTRGEPSKAHENTRVFRLIASRERDEGNPAINAHHTVSLWNMLDATLSDLLALLFASKPEALQIAAFEKLSFSVAEYEHLSKVQRMKRAVAELKRHCIRNGPATLHRGVEIYEKILLELGVHPPASRNHEENLSELRAVRNIIVHNMSLVDERFILQCPWLKTAVGMEVKIRDEEYSRYKGAASTYVASVFIRVAKKFPIPSSARTRLKHDPLYGS